MITCAKCKRNNPDDSQRCYHCGALVEPTTKMQPPMAKDFLTAKKSMMRGTHSFGKKKTLYFYTTTTHQYLLVDPRQPNGVIIGRSDPITNYTPDVDLLAAQGLEMGVSRKHARLVLQNDSLHIVDLNSTNGTHINGLRLPPYQGYALSEGDELILGRLKVIVNFADQDKPFAQQSG